MEGGHALQLGAALAYYTIFSIAPLLLIVIAIAGLVWDREVKGVVEYGKGTPKRPPRQEPRRV